MRRAFIWDLDGTLIDSYPAIVASLQTQLGRHGLEMDRRAILDAVKRRSVHEFLLEVSAKTKVAFPVLKEEYSALADANSGEIRAMPGAEETLAGLMRLGAIHFVYTHKGDSAPKLLKRLGLSGCFQEIVTSAAGFRRKPDPQALCYLLEKYGLEHADTYYVGDRELDVRCAENAGVSSILLDDGYCSCKADYSVDNLSEICGLFIDVERRPDEESTENA